MSPFVQERGKALVSAIQRGFVGQEDDAKMAGFRRLAKATAMYYQDLRFHEELTNENLVTFFDVQPRKCVKSAPRSDTA